MAGLEDLSRSQAVLTRTAAVAGLVHWAEWSGGGGQPLGVLIRVYDRLPERSEGEESLILTHLSAISDEPEAVAFLRRVAISESEWEGIPISAIEELARMGGRGRAALESLHQTGEVKLTLARLRLEELAANGYRIGGEA